MSTFFTHSSISLGQYRSGNSCTNNYNIYLLHFENVLMISCILVVVASHDVFLRVSEYCTAGVVLALLK
nr:hypothetical protein [uncultured Flavobacterium sp.]